MCVLVCEGPPQSAMKSAASCEHHFTASQRGRGGQPSHRPCGSQAAFISTLQLYSVLPCLGMLGKLHAQPANSITLNGAADLRFPGLPLPSTQVRGGAGDVVNHSRQAPHFWLLCVCRFCMLGDSEIASEFAEGRRCVAELSLHLFSCFAASALISCLAWAQYFQFLEEQAVLNNTIMAEY